MADVILDTNIMLDYLSPTRTMHLDAVDVLEQLLESDVYEPVILAASIKDAYYILSKQYGEPTGRRLVNALLGLVAVVPLGGEECLFSIDSSEPDFEDGLVRACAELNDIDFIITRDAAAFGKSRVRAVDCKEYLEIVS